MEYIKQTRKDNSICSIKEEIITREEAISYLGEKRLDALINDNRTAKSMGCAILQEVNPTYYGTSGLWVGVSW